MASRRRLPQFRRFAPPAMLACLLLTAGCIDSGTDLPELVWGRAGVSPGRLQKPRAITRDHQDRLYLVDMTARIQVFDRDGGYRSSWQTPAHDNGRPTGLSFDPRGRILVADTHYYRVLIYSLSGELLQSIGGVNGHGPGQFGFVTDAVVDADGNFYAGEYGEFDRIQKFDPRGQYLLEWGSHGSEPGQFLRPQSLVFDDQQRLWVTDSCNHRLQVFDRNGKLLLAWGEQGSAPGQLYYPYDLAFDGQGHVYVCEFGNSRVQKFTLDGQSVGCWGTYGRAPGQLNNPWGLVRDSQGRLHVLDSNNHRVQRIEL
ncbi:MAG: SMP-30/gluconolactonase/LRE family protein [Pirellulales bacterium]|nr:SMP-30/gluconolactonase/LRE family protein [Pirellulales bacterium]